MKNNRRFPLAWVLSAAVLGLSAAFAWWYAPIWRANNAIKIARQWLDAGKQERAAEAVRHALIVAPRRVEAWQLAADFAAQTGQRQAALEYRRQAAKLSPSDAALAIDWAAAALEGNELNEADTALQTLSQEQRGRSARAERLTGEIFRRRGELAAAREHFEAALRLGGAKAENEIPLGMVLLAEQDAATRARGVALLERWQSDPHWGAEALRRLLADAVLRKETDAIVKSASALIVHPARERSDTLNCLLSFGEVRPEKFSPALADVEQAWAKDPAAVSDLVGWLSGTKRGAEALRWTKTLPREITTVPPVSVTLADTLRVLGDWPALRNWTEAGDWKEVDFLRRAYLALAERESGNLARADELWRGLRSMAELDGGHGLFLAGTLYSWGNTAEAVELWWLASNQPGVAVPALGSLARYFQLRRDADGLYRVFRRLYEVRSDDPRVANNFAYLSALTGHGLPEAQRIARSVYEKQPDDPAFCSTYIFVLHRSGADQNAVALLPKIFAAAESNPSIAFTCAVVAAETGRKEDARKFLAKVDEQVLTLQEAALLKSARAAAEKL